MTYLIAHKVRGEPAFDIAIRCDDMGTESDPGPWWIIPTSGHRAYPYEYWLLEDLFDGSDYPHARPYNALDRAPPEWPDHYTVRASATSTLKGLVERLGLGRKPQRVWRRPV